ncbi:MAG: DUF1439 domain-containing protein [Verrucomicrobiota bacterium]
MALFIGGNREQNGAGKAKGKLADSGGGGEKACGEGRRDFLCRGDPMVRILLIVMVAAVLGGAFALYYFKEEGYRIELTPAEIEAQLDEKFPVEKEYLKFVKLRLSRPGVDFPEGRDRIRVSLDALMNLRFPGTSEKEVDGACVVTFGLKYDAEDFGFYLVDSQVEKLDIGGVPPMWSKKVGEFALATANLYLTRYPVYTLEAKDMKGFATTMVLEDVSVRGGKLVIQLGI